MFRPREIEDHRFWMWCFYDYLLKKYPFPTRIAKSKNKKNDKWVWLLCKFDEFGIICDDNCCRISMMVDIQVKNQKRKKKKKYRKTPKEQRYSRPNDWTKIPDIQPKTNHSSFFVIICASSYILYTPKHARTVRVIRMTSFYVETIAEIFNCFFYLLCVCVRFFFLGDTFLPLLCFSRVLNLSARIH